MVVRAVRHKRGLVVIPPQQQANSLAKRAIVGGLSEAATVADGSWSTSVEGGWLMLDGMTMESSLG